MRDITETLKSMISEFEQVVRDNTKLNEDIQALEKEKRDGYKKFNTDTHVLVERDTLENISDELSSAKHDAQYAEDEASSAYSYADNACSNATNALDGIRDAIKSVDELLTTEEETTEVA